MGFYTSCAFQQQTYRRKVPTVKEKKKAKKRPIIELSDFVFTNPMEIEERDRIIEPEIQKARMNLLNIMNQAKTRVTQDLSNTIYDYIMQHGSDYWINKTRSDYVDKIILSSSYKT